MYIFIKMHTSIRYELISKADTINRQLKIMFRFAQ